MKGCKRKKLEFFGKLKTDVKFQLYIDPLAFFNFQKKIHCVRIF